MMFITRYIIKENTSKSMGNLVKMSISIVITIILFDMTLYLAFYTASRNSICRSQTNGLEVAPQQSPERLMTPDHRGMMSFVGYIEFERLYLIEHILYPLTLTRRVFPLNAKSISRISSEDNLHNDLNVVTDCAQLELHFDTNNNKYYLQSLNVSIPYNIVKMDWTCQVRKPDINFSINESYSNLKRFSYPCFRDASLSKGSKGIAAILYIEDISISMNDGPSYY